MRCGGGLTCVRGIAAFGLVWGALALAATGSAWAASASPADTGADGPERQTLLQHDGRDRPQGEPSTPEAGGRDRPQGTDSPSATDGNTIGDPRGLIAYAGSDGNIWVTPPDGRDQAAVTTNGSVDAPFARPHWSPDGTMLVFERFRHGETGGYEHDGIYLLRDGTVARLSTISGCRNPVFDGSSQRLVFTCGDQERPWFTAAAPTGPPTLEELETRPEIGFVSTSRLDGSDWRVLLPYRLGEFPDWGGSYAVSNLSVSPDDGAVLVTTSGSLGTTIALFSGAMNAEPLQTGCCLRPGAFAPNGIDLLVRVCEGECFRSRSGFTESYAILRRDGTLVETVWTVWTLPPDTFGGVASLASDGRAVAFATGDPATPEPDGTVQVAWVPSGEVVPIASGVSPMWQPVPAELSIPSSTSGG